MKRTPHRERGAADRDGVRVVRDGRRGPRSEALAVAVVLASALGAFVLLRFGQPRFAADAPEPRAAPDRHRVLPTLRGGRPRGDARGTAALRRARVVRRAAPAVADRAAPDAATAAPAEQQPQLDAADYIAALRAQGETTGLAAFPPPGTRPVRSGVVVPPDYELPEGFARHYQTTDDGEQLEPVLVVAPGYEILDDAGDPVPLADDRIVPPDYAPPDLPLRLLEIPTRAQAGEAPR